MERKIVLRLIIVNLIIASLIILDLIVPGKESQVRELEGFYSSYTNTAGYQNPTNELRHIVDFSNGDRYRIGNRPDNDYPKGTKLKIIESRIFENINEIILVDRNAAKIYVGFFYNTLIFCLFLLTISISIVNFYISNKALHIFLIGATMFLTVSFSIYIIFY